MSAPHSSRPTSTGHSLQSYSGQGCQMCPGNYCQPFLAEHCQQTWQSGQSCPKCCQLRVVPLGPAVTKQIGRASTGQFGPMTIQIRSNTKPVITRTRSTECLPSSTRIIARTYHPSNDSFPRHFRPTEFSQQLRKISASVLAKEISKIKYFRANAITFPHILPAKDLDRHGFRTASCSRGKSSSSLRQCRVPTAFDELLQKSAGTRASLLSSDLIQHMIEFTLAKNTPSASQTQSSRSRDGARVPIVQPLKSFRSRLRFNEPHKYSPASSITPKQRRQRVKVVAKKTTRHKGHSTHASSRGIKKAPDYPNAARGFRTLRTTEVRYLNDVRKSLRTALGIDHKQRTPCQALLERYHNHIRAHHQKSTSSTTRDIQQEELVQSVSRMMGIKHNDIGFSPETARSSQSPRPSITSRLSQTIRNSRTTVSPKYSSVAITIDVPTSQACAGGSTERSIPDEPCTCPESQLTALIAKSQNIFTCDNYAEECACLTSGIPMGHIVEDWLAQLPFRGNYNRKDQEAKYNALSYLQCNLKKYLEHENEWRDIIGQGFDQLPLWLPSDPKERAQYKEAMQEDLFQRLKQVVQAGLTQKEYFDAFIVAFVRRLAFDAKVNKYKLVENLTAKLRETALMTPESERCNAYLKIILQELVRWPVKYNRKSTEQAQGLANSLASLQIPHKAWVQVTRDKVLSIIKSWYHTLPFKCEANAGVDIDLISDVLADDIQKIYEKNNAKEIWNDLRNVIFKHLSVLLSPDKRHVESEKLVNKLIAALYVQNIEDWLESVPFDTGTGTVRKDDFVEDLTKALKYVSLIPNNQLEVSKMAQTILKKMNDVTVSCDEIKKEPLAVELAEELCLLPKEKGMLHNMTDIILKWIDNLNFLSTHPENKSELATEIAIDLNNIRINKLAEEVWDIMHMAVLDKLEQLPVNMSDLEKETAAEELVNRLVAENFYYSVLTWITSVPFAKDSHIDIEKYVRGLSNQLKLVMDTEADCAKIESGLKMTAMHWLTDMHVECSPEEQERLAEGLVDILINLPREKNIIRDAVRKLFKQIPLSEEEKPRHKLQHINDLTKKIEDKVNVTKPEDYWNVIKVTAAKAIKDIVARNEICNEKCSVSHLGEKVAKDIINGMIYDAVSSLVHIVPFPPEQDKQAIISDLMNILTNIASNTLPDQQKEAIKNKILYELQKNNVLCTEDDLKPLIDVLADKVNALPQEKDLFNDIVRDWVKKIPFLEPPSGGLLKFTFDLIQSLKKNCNGRPATKNCRENCISTILEILQQQKLKCSYEQAKELAEQLVDKLASLLFNETVNQWVQSLPLKDNLPIDREALLVKVQNVLRKIICEFQYDPENGKSQICDEILKILANLPIACDQEDEENVRKILAESLAYELMKFPVMSDPGTRLISELTQMHPAYFDLTVENIKFIVKKMTVKYIALTEKKLAKPEIEKEIKKEIDVLIGQLLTDNDNSARTLLEGVIVSLSKVEMEALVKKLMVKVNDMNNELILKNQNIIKQDIRDEIYMLLQEKEQPVEKNAVERLATKLFQQIIISKNNLNEEKIQDELFRYRKIIKEWITQIPELQIITPSDIKPYEEICEMLIENIKEIKEQTPGTSAKEDIIDEIKERLDKILQIKNVTLEPSERRKLVYKLIDKLNKNLMNGALSVESMGTRNRYQNWTQVNENDFTENISNTYSGNMRKGAFNEGYLTTHYKTKDFKAKGKLSHDNYNNFVNSLHEIESKTIKDALESPNVKLSGNLKVSTQDKIENIIRINAYKDQGTFVDPKIRNSLTDEIFSSTQLKTNEKPISFGNKKNTEWLENTPGVSCCSSSLQTSNGQQPSSSKVTLNYMDFKDLNKKMSQNYDQSENLPNFFRNNVNKSKSNTEFNAFISDFLDKNDNTEKYLRHKQQSSNENNIKIVFTKDPSAESIDKNVQTLNQNELHVKISTDYKKPIQSISAQEIGNMDAIVENESNSLFLNHVDQEKNKLLNDLPNPLTSELSRNAKINVITKEIYKWINEIPGCSTCDLEQDELRKLLNETLVSKLMDVELKDLSKILSQKEMRQALFAILNALFIKKGESKSKLTERTKDVHLQVNLTRTTSNLYKRSKELNAIKRSGYYLTPRVNMSRKIGRKNLKAMDSERQLIKKHKTIESISNETSMYINRQLEFPSDETLQKKKLEDVCKTLVNKLITDETKQHKTRNSILYNIRDRLDKYFFLAGMCIDSRTKQTLAESLMELVDNKAKFMEKQIKLSNTFKRNIYLWLESYENFTITYNDNESGEKKWSEDLAMHLAKLVLQNCDCNTSDEKMLLFIKKKLNRALSEERQYLHSSTVQELAEDLLEIVNNITTQLITLDQINTQKYSITIQDCLEDLPGIAPDTQIGKSIINRTTAKITAALNELDKENINTTKRNQRVKFIIQKNLDIAVIENLKKKIEKKLTEKPVDGARQSPDPKTNEIIVYDLKQINTNYDHNTSFTLRGSSSERKEKNNLSKQHSQEIIAFKRFGENTFDEPSGIEEIFDEYFKSIFNKERKLSDHKMEQNPEEKIILSSENEVSQWLADMPVLANVTETNTMLGKHICQTLAMKLSQLRTTETYDTCKRKALFKDIGEYLDYALDMINQNMILSEQKQWTEKLLNQITSSVEKLEFDETLRNFEGFLLETATQKQKKCNNANFLTEPKIYCSHNISRFTVEPKICFPDVSQSERRYWDISKQIPVAVNKKMLSIIATNLDDIIRPLGHDLIYNQIFDLLVAEGGLLMKDADEFTSFVMGQAHKLALKAISDEIYLMNLVNQEITGPTCETDMVTVGIDILPAHLKPKVNESTIKYVMQDLSEEVSALRNTPDKEKKIREKIRKKLNEIYGDLEENEFKRLESDIYLTMVEGVKKQNSVNLAKIMTKSVRDSKMHRLLKELSEDVISLKNIPGGEKKIEANIWKKLTEVYSDLNPGEIKKLQCSLLHFMLETPNAAKTWIKNLPSHIKPIVNNSEVDKLLEELGKEISALKHTLGGDKKIRDKIHEKLKKIYGHLDDVELKRLESSIYHIMVRDARSKQKTLDKIHSWFKTLLPNIKPIMNESQIYEVLNDLIEDVNILKDTPGGEREIREKIREKLKQIFGDLNEDKLERLVSKLYQKILEDGEDFKHKIKSIAEYIEEWCDKLPIQGDPEEVKAMKQNLINQLINKVNQLNADPEIFNDIDMYQDILFDEIQQELLDMPNQDFDANLTNLVEDLVCNLLKARQSILNEKAGKLYKSKLKNAAGNVLPIPSILSTNEAAELEVLKDRLADAFMHLKVAESCNRLCLFIESIFDDIERFYHKIALSCHCAPDTHRLREELYKAFLEVPVPRCDFIKSEVEQAAVRDIINKWMGSLSLRQESGVETLHRQKLAALLAKKLYDIEAEKEYNPLFNVDREMSEAITKFLKKIPLDIADQFIPKITFFLISKLKETECDRKYKPCQEKCHSSGFNISCQLEPGGNSSLGAPVRKRVKSTNAQTGMSCNPSGSIQCPGGLPTSNRVKQYINIAPSDKEGHTCSSSAPFHSAVRKTCRQPDKSSFGTICKRFKPFAHKRQLRMHCKSDLNQQCSKTDTGCSAGRSFSFCKIISQTPSRYNTSTNANCLPPNATSINPSSAAHSFPSFCKIISRKPSRCNTATHAQECNQIDIGCSAGRSVSYCKNISRTPSRCNMSTNAQQCNQIDTGCSAGRSFSYCKNISRTPSRCNTSTNAQQCNQIDIGCSAGRSFSYCKNISRTPSRCNTSTNAQQCNQIDIGCSAGRSFSYCKNISRTPSCSNTSIHDNCLPPNATSIDPSSAAHSFPSFCKIISREPSCCNTSTNDNCLPPNATSINPSQRPKFSQYRHNYQWRHNCCQTLQSAQVVSCGVGPSPMSTLTQYPDGSARREYFKKHFEMGSGAEAGTWSSNNNQDDDGISYELFTEDLMNRRETVPFGNVRKQLLRRNDHNDYNCRLYCAHTWHECFKS